MIDSYYFSDWTYLWAGSVPGGIVVTWNTYHVYIDNPAG
jgi:hypothetical protein